MPEATKTRTRDAEATKARILDAASAEFAEHGIAGARVDRIAAAADANKSLIYAYFGNKDGLFDAVFEALVASTVEEVPIAGAKHTAQHDGHTHYFCNPKCLVKFTADPDRYLKPQPAEVVTPPSPPGRRSA